MTLTNRIASLVGATLLLTAPASTSQRLEEATTLEPVVKEEVVAVEEPVEVEEKEASTTLVWRGRGFSETEQRVLAFLQQRGITDRAALATIMGNIKQESRFHTLICEGGVMTGYHRCHRGGFGLIQWTTIDRYNGLGWFSKKHGLDPNSLDAQLRWMVNEHQWTKNEYVWKTPGKSINQYMNAAYRWLGWGIHGHRTSYAHAYYSALYQA